ncbi:MAG: cyclic nucleotide-binding domain-containing protein [Deltaproteobacteria bacterium]|nr:cyclic nucleotide-binding domain-containing protein [Deltaproteobacteria bacterium]
MEAIIPSDIRRLFHEHGSEVILETGEILFHQGDASDAVYYVLSGSLDVFAKNGLDDPALLNCVEAGHLLGEMGAITQSPRSATLIATSRTVLSRIPTPYFRALLADALSLVETMVSSTRGNLISADTARIHLGNRYEKIQKRVSMLGEEKEQLKELLLLREELESMVMHDLRNPLNTVVMALGLMEPLKNQLKDPDQFILLVQMAKAATKSMTQLISMLLDIARLEAGKLVLKISEFDLSAMFKELVATQQMQLLYKSTDITIQVPPGLIVKADRDLLWRVVVNLLDNAMKFAPEQSKIELMACSMDNQAVHISVTDAGPGIPTDDRKRIFEKFTQVNDTEHMARKGTGLGLTFCQMAVEAHGGSIWVDGGPLDAGCCMHVRIPNQ